MLSFNSSIQKSADLKTKSCTDNWRRKNGPRTNIWKRCAKKCNIFLINDSKRPTYNYLRRGLKPPKRCPGGRCLHPQRPQSVFWRGWGRRGCWNFILQMLARVHLFWSTQLTVEGWVIKSADFWIQESKDNINTFLTSYKPLL